ncbi:MAG: PilZ domain-containing protein [Planctomycetota bacterium]|jgi:c-di-GMP-binding flagellar brake protein YcgR
MDRRQQYRVQPDGPEALRVTIERTGRKAVAGEAMDVSVGGALVRLEAQDVRELTVGEQVRLHFTGGQLNAPLVATATVVHRCDIDEGDGCNYGLQFMDRDRLEGELTPELFRLFNRRGSYRVQPDAKKPVTVTVEVVPDGPRAHGRMVDISATGIGVHVPAAVEAALVAVSRIRVSFTLPTSDDPLCLEGIIRSRRLIGGEAVRYGILFMLDAGEAGQDQQSAIIDYVRRRQQDRLRAAAAR